MFNAIYLTRENKVSHAELKQLDERELPEGEVDIDIQYSALNYKDALAVTGRGAIARKWPMVPGIDLAGVVSASRSEAWKPGESVVITGWGLSETHWGGLSQKARVPESWVMKCPEPFTPRQTMIIATAGVTAALSVIRLQGHGLKPGDDEILVTGAAGGVGSIAISLLASLGYKVIASTGRLHEADYLKSLGAAELIDRNELSQAGGRPLQSERWAGVIDSVGSHTLANACAATRWNGAVASCGLAQGADFPGTVMPFILRAVTLYGVNTAYFPDELRQRAWGVLASHLDLDKLDRMAVEIGLTEVLDFSPELLAGKVPGRTVVDVNR